MTDRHNKVVSNVRVHCDRCNKGLSGDINSADFCIRVVKMMVEHRRESYDLVLHRAGSTVYFPRWLITGDLFIQIKESSA